MTPPTRDELELYVMGEFDGDTDALEAGLDDAARAFLADEARFEMLLRDAGAQATFCPGCRDLVGDKRCDACGAAVKPGGYVVERVLVSNAHGRMYVARDADGTQVALKELAFVQSPSLEMVAAFEREAKFLRALEHPAIPRFVASFEEGTGVHVRYYLAQELVTGTSLDAMLEDHWFSEAEITDIARQVLAVLGYLQSVSPMVIHRDIKPANLVKRDDGSIAVVDFGAAHVQGTTAGSTSIGTFGYMPIEQLAGEVDATTDPYALGASLLHLLSRQEPWRILQTRSLDTINVSPALRAFLAKLVAPEPRDRFANAAAALAALENLEATMPNFVDTAVETRSDKKRRRFPRWVRPVAYAAAAIALVMSGVGGYALFGPSSERPAPEAPLTLPGVDTGAVRVSLAPVSEAKLFADGQFISVVTDGSRIPLSPGLRALEIRGPAGQVCSQTVLIETGATTPIECRMPGKHSLGADLPPSAPIDLSFKAVSIHDAMRLLAKQCKLNIIVPDAIDAQVDVDLKQVPCEQALEVILESHGLWYEFIPDGNVVRVSDRKSLDAEREERVRRDRLRITDDVLPAGATIDVDFMQAPLHDILRMLADTAHVNIVIPDTVDGRITIRAKAMPWHVALRAVLEAHGLWYRYRENGKILRIAPRKDIDRENEAAAREAQPRQ